MDVRFYETSPGRSPVLDYLRPLPEKQRKLVGGVIRAIQDANDLANSGAKVRPLRLGLSEIRVGYHRLIFVVKGSTLWLLHAFQKDTQKTPDTEIRTAEARMRDVLARK